MSTEDESELKELLVQTLESSGILPQIRAQLRASVFLALEEANATKKPLHNNDLQELLLSNTGKQVALLIRDFLQFYNMKSSLSVFDMESCFGKLYDNETKHSVIISNGSEVHDGQRSQLEVILERNIVGSERKFGDYDSVGVKFSSLKTNKLELVGENLGTSRCTPSLVNQPIIADVFSTNPSNSWTDSDPIKKLDQMFEKESSYVPNQQNSPVEGCHSDRRMLHDEVDGQHFTRLTNTDIKNGNQLSEKKSLLLSDYDEDFQSSTSVYSNQKSGNAGSEEEIEESLAEIFDAESQEQISTLDNSISQICDVDYIENLK